MHEDDASGPLREAFSAWLEGVKAGAAARTAPMPASLAKATRAQLASLGLAYDDDVPHFGRKFVGTGDLRAEHAPGDAHAALSLALYDETGAWWWIDGQPLALPADAPAGLVLDGIGRWADAHILAIEIGGLDHPLADPRLNDPLGEFRGLLLHDAARGCSRLVLPAAHERWPDPSASVVDGRIAIHADRRAGNRPPARWLDTLWPATTA